ncbi:MAG: hypothetical protein V3R99_09005, partial [Thermoguttaceae bacterium]
SHNPRPFIRCSPVIAHDEPYPTMSVRQVFSYALALCEASGYDDRLLRLFEVATMCQDRDPQSAGYGNFKWTWRDQGVTDRNAVEFCMQHAVVVWADHPDSLTDPVRRSLRELLDHALEGCLRHRVTTSYTNIAILNAGNLILLGELLDRPDAAVEGYRRLDAVCLWTWLYGTYEYCSPTYYGVDLDGLLLIEARAGRDSARRQARALLKLLWTDVAANWFEQPTSHIAGPHSRSYDYLQGSGNIDRYFWFHGWLSANPPNGTGMLRPLLGQWSPPESLRELSRQYPRLVRQSWGMRPAESRTHFLCRDVTLGCSGATYGAQDIPLTIDLPGRPWNPRCYFIADGRNDPYGLKKYATSSAKHMKALHLKPFWAGAQRTHDALGLVVYRPGDLEGDEVTDLQSHLVLRRDVDRFYLAGRPIELPRGTPRKPSRIELRHGEPLVFRLGTAAVGIRVPWSRGQDGRPGTIGLIDDGNPLGAIRLTVDHRTENATTEAGAAFWVRIGSGLETDDAFEAWHRRFAQAVPKTVDVSENRIKLEVSGDEGPVSIEATSPYGLGGRTRLVPTPAATTLELDGREVGRPLLETIEPVRRFRESVAAARPIDVPAEGGVYWDAEDGIVFPGMSVSKETDAHGGRYVSQSPQNIWGRSPGRVTWSLQIARAGHYRLWGRVLTPTPETDSFYVLTSDHTDRLPPNTASWHTGSGPGWRWVPVALEYARTPAVFNLPAGLNNLQFRVREPGAKLDCLYLTSDPNSRPK